MKIRVLGASGGSSLKDSPVSLLINDIIALDFGSTASFLSLEEQWSLKAGFVTHAHLDHIKDLPFLVDNRLFYSQKTFYVWGLPETVRALKQFIFNYHIWPDFTEIPSKEEPALILNSLRCLESVYIEKFEIIGIPVKHTVPAVGYLVKDKEKSIFYSGDTGPTPETWSILNEESLSALFVDVSYPDEKKEMALITGHLTPELLYRDLKNLKEIPPRIFVLHSKPGTRKKIKEELFKYFGQNPEIKVLKGGEVLEI